MKTMAAAIVLVAGSVALGQSQGPGWPKRVSPEDGASGSDKHKAEVALAVRRNGNDVMVSWIHFESVGSSGVAVVHYNVSTNGQNFRTDPGAIPFPTPLCPNATIRTGDPMVAFAADGRGWVGALDGWNQRRFWVASKPPGAAYAQNPREVHLPSTSQGVDKGVLFAGSPVGGAGPDYLGLAFTRTYLNPTAKRLRGVLSPDVGAVCGEEAVHFRIGQEHAEGNEGGPNAALMLRNVEPGLVGRWVVAYNVGTPRAVWGNPNTGAWQNSVNPTHYTVPCPAPCNNPHTTAPIPGWLSSTFLAPGGAKTVPFPSMAADPNNGNIIYMVFPANFPEPGMPKNADLVIARSTNAGQDFSRLDLQSEHGTNVLRLRDIDLGDEPGIHQFMPAIAVDHHGGVNIVYYTAKPLPDIDVWPPLWEYQVKYARIAEFRTYPHPSVVSFPLTGTFDLADVPEIPTESCFGSQPQLCTRFLGDYIMADARRCDLYAGYVSQHETGPVHVYVSRITACIEVDFNGDSQVTSADLEQFVSLFAAGNMRADLDRDGQLTIADFDRFQLGYTCACNP
jgi:hypothetical protein